MKKFRALALILAAAVVLTAFCGCDFKIKFGKDSKESDTTDTSVYTGGVSSDNVSDPSSEKEIEDQVNNLSDDDVKKGNEFFSVTKPSGESGGISDSRIDAGKSSGENDGDIFASKKYTVTGRIVSNGETSHYKMAQNGNKLSVMTYYNGKPIGFILNSVSVYIVNADTKTYLIVPKKVLEAADDTGKLSSVFDGSLGDSTRAVVSEGSETVEGKKLTYKKYDDGTVAYYSGNAIVMSKNTDGSVIYYDSVVNEAPASLFLPPKGYKMQELTVENIKDYQ